MAQPPEKRTGAVGACLIGGLQCLQPRHAGAVHEHREFIAAEAHHHFVFFQRAGQERHEFDQY